MVNLISLSKKFTGQITIIWHELLADNSKSSMAYFINAININESSGISLAMDC